MEFESDFYVISSDFKLISFNKTVANRYKGIKVGDFCYEATMNRKSPCLHCPIAGNSKNENPIYFDPFYNGWVQANFSYIGNDKYCIVCHASENFKIKLLSEKENENVKNIALGRAANELIDNQVSEQVKIINGLSGIFNSLLLIDIEKKIYKRLKTKLPESENLFCKDEGIVETAIFEIIEKHIAPETKGVMKQFTNLKTLNERISNKKIITQEYLGIFSGWSQASFIPIEWNEKGELRKVLLGSRKIHEDFKDSLTNCYTRRALNWAYNCDFNYDKSIAIIVCDLNGLKLRNDTEGHESGDRYICKVANFLSEFFGQNNVYRIGGDEFVVFSLEVKQSVFSRRVMEFKKLCLSEKIDVSIGYVFREKFDIPFEKLLADADAKMYEAKRDYYRRKGINWNDSRDMSRYASYIDSLIDYGSFNYFVCRINLTKNTYDIIYTMEGYDTTFIKYCKTFEELLYYPVKSGVVHKDDIDDYLKYSNIDYLRKLARDSHGKLEHWVRYRSNYNKKKYQLIEAQFFSSRDYTDDNQICYAYLKDMGLPFSENRILFDQLLRELSENFESIYYINFDDDVVRPYRANDPAARKYPNRFLENLLYEATITSYIDNFVVESDKKSMYKFCSEMNLRKLLKAKRAVSIDYIASIDGNEVCYRMKFSNMEGVGELHHCVMGLANVNSETLSRRSFQNAEKCILLIDDSPLNREMLIELLKDDYCIYEAENGLDAMNILSKKYKDISIILTDIEMPICNGFDFISRIKENSLYKNIPILVVTAHDDEECKTKCLELGASDLVTKPYNLKILTTRINSLINFHNIATTLNTIEIDGLTGLYTKEAFYRYAQIILDTNTEQDYIIMISNIVGFKMINEQYGKEMGDQVLSYLASTGLNNQSVFSIGGRINSDIFVCIRPEQSISKEEESYILSVIQGNAPVPIILKFGLYHTKDDRTLSIQQMCDRAVIAMNSIKGEYGVLFANYDEKMRQKIMLEQKILDNMEIALEKEYFQVFYQPKFDIKENKIAGAEALVRWIDPKLGFMNPGDFIPLFEKNGFITELDKFVWRKVCEEIAYFISIEKPFPVSINVSRKDFSDPNLAEFFIDLTKEFNIPHNLLHIEVTESAYSDNPSQMLNTISMLHANDFVIELDDFGTGYSSITVLNSMMIDILKIDMSIIKNDNRENGKSVLEFSMELAKMMKLKTIQEGIETETELTRVKNLGCDYVQGYYFSKPLSKKDFEEYVRNL